MGVSAGKITFWGDWPAIREGGLVDEDLLLFEGGFEGLKVVPGVVVAVLKVAEAAEEACALFLKLHFEVLALRGLDGVFGRRRVFFVVCTEFARGLKTAVLVGELGGAVLQTFPLLSRGKGFGLERGVVAMIGVLETVKCVPDSR